MLSDCATTDVDAQEEDLNDKRKQIIALQKEKEGQENRFLALEKSVATLEKAIAIQTDEITSLKADNTRKRKQIDDGRAERKAAEAALSARIRVLEQEMQAWAKNLEDIAKQANHLATSSTPAPSSSTSSGVASAAPSTAGSSVRMTRSAAKRARNEESAE